MWDDRDIHWLRGSWLNLGVAFAIAACSMPLQAASSSTLSRWLSSAALPELQQLLAQHPRYAQQRVLVAGGAADGLSNDIASVLSSELAGHPGITLIVGGAARVEYRATPGSIDELDCLAGPDFDYVLQVSAVQPTAGRDQVRLELIDVSTAGEPLRSWQWRGEFSDAERAQLRRASPALAADGSLNAPWSDGDVEAAAHSLSRNFACALRPWIKSRLGLQWADNANLPTLFAATVNTSRALLGSYGELGVPADNPHYSVNVRIERFAHDTWQLWLTGTPHRADLPAVHAYTYFKSSDPGPPLPVARPALAEALDFIDVELVDATQADRGQSRADLQLTLRIANRAEWPIEYAFSLSGGHFDYCVASPGYYRHDHYGRLVGSVAPGASVVRKLIIENAQHRPTPWFGIRKCAGFRDLQGFEEFASQGHKVTDFVRWQL